MDAIYIAGTSKCKLHQYLVQSIPVIRRRDLFFSRKVWLILFRRLVFLELLWNNTAVIPPACLYPWNITFYPYISPSPFYVAD
jgi:hypothetical protein